MASRPTQRRAEVLIDEAGELDFSDPVSDDYEALSRDRVPVRSMIADDLHAIVEIDRAVTGLDRTAHYERLFAQTVDQSGVRMSLVAEMDGRPVGYIMARVDYGEFGRTEPAAVMDTLGIHPDYAGQGIATALMSQLLANLGALKTDRVRMVVAWDSFDLLQFLAHRGFRPSQRLVFRRPVQ